MSWPATSAHHQAHAGAGVAEVEVAVGLGEAADAAAQHLPRVAPTLRTGRPCAPTRLGGVEHVLALEQAARCAVRPVASAPSISARWEIDLSPGTRTRPDSARDLPAESGEGECVRQGRPGLWLGSHRPPGSSGRGDAALP